jgi:hypothetical protein
MRRLMLSLVLVGFAGGTVVAQGREPVEQTYNPCAWLVSAIVMHLNNDPLTDPVTSPTMSWTIKGVSAGQYGTVEGAQEQAEHVGLAGIWTQISPTPTKQTATFYPPAMIQRVVIQGPSDPRCDPAPTFIRDTPRGRRER